MDRFKILHLSNVYGPNKGGGIHEVVSNFYKYQKQLQHQPSIWFSGSSTGDDSIRLDSNLRELPMFGPRQLGILKGLFEAVPNEVSSFDIIHQHGLWTPLSLYSQKLRRKSNLKLVLQPHGFLEPYRLNISKFKKKLAYQFFEKSNLLTSAALIACSEDEALKLKMMFPNNNVAVIFNGVAPEFYSAEFSLSAASINKKRMLFLSQIIPIKGLERLLHILSDIGVDRFSEWEFLIAGYGNEPYINFLKKLTIQLKLTSLISFVGTKIGREKIEIYDSSDVFILPTFSENYGIVIAEALARGVPVVTTKGTPWAELHEFDCGLWVDNSHEGLKQGMLKILQSSPSKLKAMGCNGRALVEDKYLWNKTTLRTIELYRWILHGGSKPEFVL